MPVVLTTLYSLEYLQPLVILQTVVFFLISCSQMVESFFVELLLKVVDYHLGSLRVQQYVEAITAKCIAGFRFPLGQE